MRSSRPRLTLLCTVLAWTVGLSAYGQYPAPGAGLMPCDQGYGPYGAAPCSYMEGCGQCAPGQCGPDGQCEPYCCEEGPPSMFGECCLPTRAYWTYRGEVLFLQRDHTRSQELFVERNPDATVLDAKDIDFPVGVGFQVGAIRQGKCGLDVEVGFFHISDWIANRTFDDAAYMVTGVNGGAYLVHQNYARYASQINLGEINLRREYADGFSLLAGFRMGELDEMYTAGGLTGTSGLAPIDMYCKTFNQLYGLQVGADWEFYNMGGPLKINALCKAGIYGNRASQRINRFDSADPASNVTLEADRDQATFIGEAGLGVLYQITNHLSFRASAQAVWFEGVALAPEQINMSDFALETASIDTHGGMFYYGGGVGLELTY